jgi:ABC-type multidrug transport system fused ATPase/permease subunit
MSNLKNKIPKWVYWVWLISIVSLGLSIASIFVAYDICWNVEMVSTAIVLGFVGIIATFVVVTNHSQIDTIKRDIDRKINTIDEQVKDMTVNLEVIQRNYIPVIQEFGKRLNTVSNDKNRKVTKSGRKDRTGNSNRTGE